MAAGKTLLLFNATFNWAWVDCAIMYLLTELLAALWLLLSRSLESLVGSHGDGDRSRIQHLRGSI